MHRFDETETVGQNFDNEIVEYLVHNWKVFSILLLANLQWVQHSFIFWVALPLPLIAKNLSGTPAPTPALKKEWHSFSTPFKRVCAPFSTPITKFLESKLPKPKKICNKTKPKFFPPL